MKYYLFLLVLIVVSISDMQGQSTSFADFIRCVEMQNGTDNLVMNGRPYSPSNIKAEGHPYFQTKQWRSGLVYINGNSYLVNRLKYNLSSDQVIMKHERPNGTTQKVILSDLLIDSFQVDGHLFINRVLVLPEKGNSSYLEKIFVGKLSFFRLQKKVMNAIYNKTTPHGQFTSKRPIYYLLLDDQSYKITKKKELLACFPNHKTKIKKYIKEHSFNWKKMTNIQLSHLLKFCNDQI